MPRVVDVIDISDWTSEECTPPPPSPPPQAKKASSSKSRKGGPSTTFIHLEKDEEGARRRALAAITKPFRSFVVTLKQNNVQDDYRLVWPLTFWFVEFIFIAANQFLLCSLFLLIMQNITWQTTRTARSASGIRREISW